ncbi:hypothetical protein WJT86_12070 [Microvirga sp. W0021]|uniref:Uncharacterized protein n=1 Tax=Hohaiivirga grylli TaxID=3133970 RepID=A0ABV0BLC6_9HYPH
MNVGGSLTIGYGVSGSLNAGGGNSTSDKAWVTEQTGIYAGDNLNITVGNHTQIDGAVINSETGNLTFDTGTLGFSNIVDHDTASSMNVNVGISNDPATGKPSGGSISGSVSDRDREQVTHATVGEGEIIIRNQEEQKQDVATLNRDVEKAQEITKDESSGVDFYVSSSAIQEIGTGFKTIQENIKNLESADKRLEANVRKATSEADYALTRVREALIDSFAASGEISAASATKLKEVINRFDEIDPDSLKGACGSSQQGFNLFHWIITPAYAGDLGCALRFKGGNSLDMSEEEYTKLKQSITLSAKQAIESSRSRYDELLSKQDAGTLTSSEKIELGNLHGYLQQQMAYFELCSDDRGALRASGLIPSDSHYNTMISVAEAYRTGGDALAAEKFELTKNQAEKLMELRQTNPQLYLASYAILYGHNENLLDALFLMDGATQSGVTPQASQEMLKMAAAQIARATLPYDVTALNSLPPGITEAIQTAANGLTVEQRFALAADYYQYQVAHAGNVEEAVSNARKATGAILVTLGVAAVAVPVTEAALTCFANIMCRAEALYTLGQEGVAFATGEGAIAAGGISLTAKNSERLIEIAGEFGAFITAPATAGRNLTVGEKIGILREASQYGKGNFNLGTSTAAEANALGLAWVGPNYKVASDGKTLVSADGLRQYRPPANKPNSDFAVTGVQSNFEARTTPNGSWQSNGHLNIKGDK